ncbi:MOSC domain-containing protein [Pseudonocardia acaciae]|uniref:MOSC domain-containing protein n=1 Tax=Pseudonocardia acaciae TaxID=551276 RepID=UPI0007E8EA0C|nr:MOSC domain-containing protein [Pseudonocardia acaciae]
MSGRGTRVGTVEVCARYPVKSVQGERPERLVLEPGGVPGDRAWALRTEDGKRGSGKNTWRWARLDHMLEMSARLLDGGHGGDSVDAEALLRLPDGREFDVASPELPAALTEVVGRPVTVTPTEEGPHHDAAPVHLITSATLRWWSAQAPDEHVGWQRARPNLVIDVDGEDRAEDGWIGRQLRVGTALLGVTGPTIRCVMVTQDQLGLGRSPALLKVLAPYELALGVYAAVLEPGAAMPGDEVYLLD